MAAPTLIYCADGNRRFAEIAIAGGYLYGSQMPRTCYFDPYFIDVNPKRLPAQPDYVRSLRKYRPTMASVHDWFEDHRLKEILMRAEEIAEFVKYVLLIPKVAGGVVHLPREVGGKRVVLGYSVPTKHGKTDLPLADFAGWPVHLLGGSPGQQMKLYHEMSEFCEVVSADGNMMHKMATRGLWWLPGKRQFANRWVSFREMGEVFEDNIPYRAFERSCANIWSAWHR